MARGKLRTDCSEPRGKVEIRGKTNIASLLRSLATPEKGQVCQREGESGL